MEIGYFDINTLKTDKERIYKVLGYSKKKGTTQLEIVPLNSCLLNIFHLIQPFSHRY